MILYYFPIAQNTVRQSVIFFRDVSACLNECEHILLFFLFTGLIPVYRPASEAPFKWLFLLAGQ